jgi:hypothetical protein
VNRIVALLVLTAAFAPAAVMGALPMVTSIVLVLMVSWILLAARTHDAEPVAEPPVIPTH